MSVIFNYFDDWKEADIGCPHCGWKGKVDPEQMDVYRELFEFTCPKCPTCLAIVSFPTEREIKEHWSALTEEERQHYGKRVELDADFDAHHLSESSQLPDIGDDPLVLVWDFETGPGGEFDGPSQTVIKHLGRPIWRECAFFECVGRFGEVVDVLQKKYGQRLKDLVPTGRSLLYLTGDDYSAFEKLERFRARLSPESVDPELRLHALARAGDTAANNFVRYRKEIGDLYLQSEDQLPPLDGELLVFGCALAEDPPRVRVRCTIERDGSEELQFRWDEESGDEFLYLSLCHDDRVIWREAAPQDHPGRIDANKGEALEKRYAAIARILKRKYGDRAKDVVVTYASGAYNIDDGTIDAVRQRCFPRNAERDAGAALQLAIQRAREYGATMVKRAARKPVRRRGATRALADKKQQLSKRPTKRSLTKKKP